MYEDEVEPSAIIAATLRKGLRAFLWVTYFIGLVGVGVVLALGWSGVIPVSSPTQWAQSVPSLLLHTQPVAGSPQSGSGQAAPPPPAHQPGDQIERIARDLDQLRTGVGELLASQKKTAASVDSMQQELRTVQEQLRAAQLRPVSTPSASAAGWFADPATLTFRAPSNTRVGVTAARKAPLAAKKAAAPAPRLETSAAPGN